MDGTAREEAPKAVDIALQGGGSHGAFAWGALERLLDDRSLQIEGISGTSAGAMNAAVLAQGMVEGGRDGAKAALHRFWRRISRAALMSPFQRTPLDRALGRWSLDTSPTYLMADTLSRFMSPYVAGRFTMELNPLRAILEDMLDFEAIAAGPIKLFVTATDVKTGRGRIFRNHDLSVDALLASACLPSMYAPVEIDGAFYWDGGYAGNPTITPLVRECDSRDTILVQINPVERQDVPKMAREIINRVNEISFNAPLLKELRMIAVLRSVADAGTGEGRRWAEMRLHRISNDVMTRLDASSKLNAEWAFLEMLRSEGFSAADAFIQSCGPQIGACSSFDFASLVEDI